MFFCWFAFFCHTSSERGDEWGGGSCTGLQAEAIERSLLMVPVVGSTAQALLKNLLQTRGFRSSQSKSGNKALADVLFGGLLARSPKG